MNSVLIVSASQRAAERIAQWLGENTASMWAPSEESARGMLGANRFSFVIINAPLLDGNGEALAKKVDAEVLLLVAQDAYEETTARMGPQGVLTLPKPTSPVLFRQAVQLMLAAHAKVTRLQGKLEEVRVVERAKWALIQTLKMSEAEAHRYIEKQAMNLRRTRREVAEDIIRTYEN